MANRYTKLYELPGGLYASGSPVMICAGALLHDEIAKGPVCQLKFRGLSETRVRALTVVLQMLDAAGRPIGTSLTRSYLDLDAGQDETFGQNVALRIPYRNARAFTARIGEVVFADGTRWQDTDENWERLPKQELLRDAYGDEEMAAQFRIRYGTDCLYAPIDAGELWYCTCGTVNRREEASCHHCHRTRKALLAVNAGSLRVERDRRLEQEQYEPEEPKRSGAGRVLAVLLPSLLLLAALIYFAPRLLDRIVPLPVIPAEATNEPVQTPEPTETPAPTPESAPEPTPEPTLSPEQKQEAAYEAAQTLLDSGRYSEARTAFLSMAGYKDSERMAREAVYRKAMALFAFIEQYDEKDIYAVLSMDPAVTNRLSLSTQKALSLGSPVVDALRAACGGDAVDLVMEDTPSEGLRPLANCVKDLFAYLEDYQDSDARIAALDELTDYTRDFYMLCEAGDIFGAYNWLESYTGDFPGREHWLQLLDLYKPYCDDWVLDAGDPTLLPMIGGNEFPCTAFSSRVILNGDLATLRFLIRYSDSECVVDFLAETGTLGFTNNADGIFFNFAAVTQVDHMALMKYYDGALMGSCEYARTR